MNDILDKWHICPYEDNVAELFESLKCCTESYLEASDLDTKNIVNIVEDLRLLLNPHGNKNLSYFTDIICDEILIKHKGLTKQDVGIFAKFITECEDRVYLKL